MFSATSQRTLRAIICIISFLIVLCTYLLIFFSVLHALSPSLSSSQRMWSWVKLESSRLLWPLKGRAYLAKNVTFERVFSRFCQFTYLASLNMPDNWAEIWSWASGIISKRSWASLWFSDRNCLPKSLFFVPASCQLVKPFEMNTLSEFLLAMRSIRVAFVQVEQKDASFSAL